MKKLLYIFIGIVIAAGVLLGLDIWKCEDDWCFLFEWQKIRAADSFERCVSLGFPVIQLYPRECRAGDKSFPEGTDILVGDGKLSDVPPPKVLAAVRSVVAERFKLSENEVIILAAYKKEWPDSCLGLSPSAFGCAYVITPGYEVTVRAHDQQYTYRANFDGSLVKSL